MPSNDIYDVMRRSRAHTKDVALTAATDRIVLPYSPNRVALLITGEANSGAELRAQPTATADNVGSWLIASALVTAGGGFLHNRPVAMNIWDHGDIVRQEWHCISTENTTVTVTEVIDPDAKPVG